MPPDGWNSNFQISVPLCFLVLARFAVAADSLVYPVMSQWETPFFHSSAGRSARFRLLGSQHRYSSRIPLPDGTSGAVRKRVQRIPGGSPADASGNSEGIY